MNIVIDSFGHNRQISELNYPDLIILITEWIFVTARLCNQYYLNVSDMIQAVVPWIAY